MTAPLQYLSVCSGVEAASVAWHPLDWNPVAFSEIDRAAAAVLKHRFPRVPNLGDMTKFREWPDLAIDLLVGGTPCQAFSIAGLRQGLADPRGNLMLTYLGIADRYRPKRTLWENIPGVLSSNGGRDFGALIWGLVELGYGIAWRVLDAQYVRVDGLERAVPQRRRRVFVVGHLGSWARAAAVLFDGQSLRWDSAPRREAGKRPAPTLSARTTAGGGLGTDFELDGGLIRDIAATLDASFGRLQGASGQDASHGHSHLVAFGGNRQSGPIDVATALNTHGGASGRQDFESETFLAVAIQERAASENPDAGPWAVRRLTPRECERLQGFPDDWTRIPTRHYREKRVTALRPEDMWEPAEGGGWWLMAADGQRYKQMGNSMAVNVMRWIGRRIEMVRHQP